MNKMDAKQREQAFITLAETYKQVIYKVCYMYAADADNLNDLYQEMADITGLSRTNVAVKLNRIKEKLKTMSNR